MTYGQHPGHGRPGPGAPGHAPGHGVQGAYGHPGHGQGGHPQQPYGHPVPHGAPPYAPPYGGAPPHQGAPPQHGAPPHPYGPPPRYAAPPEAKRRREPTPAGGPVTDDDERWAVPAYVGMFVAGFVAPAIVYLARGRTSRFARFHAVQALNLSIAMTACNVVAFALIYLIGMTGLLITLATIAAEYFFIVKAAIGANRCEWYRLPSFAAWPVIR